MTLSGVVDVCDFQESSALPSWGSTTSLKHFAMLRTSANFLRGPKRQAYGLKRMTSTTAPHLVTPKEVSELTRSNPISVSVVDSSWFMPNSPRKAKDEFLAKRIPTAQYLDLDEVASDHELGLKHMMPDPKTFAEACGMLTNQGEVLSGLN